MARNQNRATFLGESIAGGPFGNMTLSELGITEPAPLLGAVTAHAAPMRDTSGRGSYKRLRISIVDCPNPGEYPSGYVQVQEVIEITRADGTVEQRTILHKGGACISPKDAAEYVAAQL